MLTAKADNYIMYIKIKGGTYANGGKSFFGIGTASFLLMLSDLLLEVFSASLFIGSKRLISYIGILIIVCAVSFTVLCFLVVKNHRGRFKSKGTRIFLRVLSIIICIMLCLVGITIDGILYTDTVKKPHRMTSAILL